MTTVRRDFFLDPTQRLTEQERALMTAMLDGLVVQIADELRALIGSSAAANDDSGHALLADLHGSGLLDIPELIALLLRRAEQIQMMSAIQSRGARREGKLIQAQLSDENAAVAAAAMTLILARGRRLDQFGQCRLDFDDVPPRAVHPLVNAVAVAIGSAEPALHHQLAAAAAQLIASHKPQRSLDVVTANLIEALADNDRLGDDWLLEAADEGEGALLAHGLARRAGIAADEAAETLLARDADQLMLLFRLAGLSRASAARLLGGLSDVFGVADPLGALASFDRVSQAQQVEARFTMVLPQEYRGALGAFDGTHGKRTV